MKVTTKSILAVMAVAATGALHAQTSSGGTSSAASATTAPSPVGILGQTYADTNFGFEDIKHSHDMYRLGLSGNQPVTPYLDARLGYSYDWLQHHPRGHGNDVSATALAYTAYDGVKPFVAAQLGYEWDQTGGHRTNFGNWGAGLGVEIPAGIISITPTVFYADDLKTSAKSSQEVSYGAEANYWVTRSTAVYGGVDYADVHKSSADYWNYIAGLRLKF